jgi:hypothetical protein
LIRQHGASGGLEGLKVPVVDTVEIKDQPHPSLESDTIENLAHPTTCNLIVLIGGGYRMKVERGLVYQNWAHIHDVSINSTSYDVVKVDMVHENMENLKSQVPPNDTILTLRDAITRRVQWRRTRIDVDQAASALTTMLALIKRRFHAPTCQVNV